MIPSPILIITIAVLAIIPFVAHAEDLDISHGSPRRDDQGAVVQTITPETSFPGQYAIRDQYGKRVGSIVKDNVFDQYIVRDEYGRKTGTIDTGRH